jgi:Protein of unknown function (DUF4235)
MADNRAEGVSKAVGAFAAFAGAYGARKLVTYGWRRITGKEPPTDPQDPRVGVGEALIWAVVLGVAMEAARLLAGRAATNNIRRADNGAQ